MRDLLELYSLAQNLEILPFFIHLKMAEVGLLHLRKKSIYCPLSGKKTSYVYLHIRIWQNAFLKQKTEIRTIKKVKWLTENVNSLLPWNSILRNVHQKTLASARISMELNIPHLETIKVRRVYIICNEGNIPSPSPSQQDSQYMDGKVAVSSKSLTAFFCCYKGKLQRQISSLKTKFLFSSTRPTCTHAHIKWSAGLCSSSVVWYCWRINA